MESIPDGLVCPPNTPEAHSVLINYDIVMEEIISRSSNTQPTTKQKIFAQVNMAIDAHQKRKLNKLLRGYITGDIVS
jgi:hypothetical protein